MHIQGGPPAPMRWCTNCTGELTGKPTHCMNKRGELFCSAICKSEHASVENANVATLHALHQAVWLGA